MLHSIQLAKFFAHMMNCITFSSYYCETRTALDVKRIFAVIMVVISNDIFVILHVRQVRSLDGI